jgi:hypothetical protein
MSSLPIFRQYYDVQERANVQGQPKFRGMWDRYCRGADAILYVPRMDKVFKLTNRYVVDAADVRFYTYWK